MYMYVMCMGVGVGVSECVCVCGAGGYVSVNIRGHAEKKHSYRCYYKYQCYNRSRKHYDNFFVSGMGVLITYQNSCDFVANQLSVISRTLITIK